MIILELNHRGGAIGKTRQRRERRKSPFGKNLPEKAKNLWHIELNVFQVQQMFVVFLLLRPGQNKQLIVEIQGTNLLKQVINL